ncbi:MAG: hypothetical protein HYY23_22260 [Verrucomicrobia bacterium]|nr:hypothetical protein [Verrucomicrobiota bacterium]
MADKRSMEVHGVGYAAFVALATMLQSHSATDLEQFQTWMITHTLKAFAQVTSDLNINQIWKEICDAHTLEVFGKTREELRRIFNVSKEKKPHPPDAPRQGEWWTCVLHFDYGALSGALEAHLRKQGRSLPLGRNDVRQQMAQNRYWIEERKSTRLFGRRNPVACWSVDLDFHPLGYQAVSDEEFERWKAEGSDGWDPRKGPLYEIVHAVEKTAEEEAKPFL